MFRILSHTSYPIIITFLGTIFRQSNSCNSCSLWLSSSFKGDYSSDLINTLVSLNYLPHHLTKMSPFINKPILLQWNNEWRWLFFKHSLNVCVFFVHFIYRKRLFLFYLNCLPCCCFSAKYYKQSNYSVYVLVKQHLCCLHIRIKNRANINNMKTCSTIKTVGRFSDVNVPC